MQLEEFRVAIGQLREKTPFQQFSTVAGRSITRAETVASLSSEHDEVSAKIAIVMPVCNEAYSIASTINEIAQKVIRFLPNSSLFVFEDGSTDNTNLVLSDLSTKYSWLRLTSTSGGYNRKGYVRAVRDALMSIDNDDFDFVLFMDSDGQYDPRDFFKLWQVMVERSSNNSRSRSAIGKAIVMGRRINRTEPSYRVVMSTGLRIIERILFGKGCQDVTSAFRLLSTSDAKSLASRVRYSGQNFWLEFTARAIEEGYEFFEIPIKYRGRAFVEEFAVSKSLETRIENCCNKGSNIYDFKKMPKIASNEFYALVRTWLEYRGKRKKPSRRYLQN